MISFCKYIQKFKHKEVIVELSDVKSIKGKLEQIGASHIVVRPNGKKTGIAIPVRNILYIEEYEK